MEMPGPTRWRSNTLVTHMLSSQKLLVSDIDERVKNNLYFVQKLAQRNPHVVYGDGKERTGDSEETRSFCRNLATQSIVLLKNSSDLLPLRPEKLKNRSIAVIGSHAKSSVISGGGSAALKPSYVITPWEGLINNADPSLKLYYALGGYGDYLPSTSEGYFLIFFSKRTNTFLL